MSASVTPTPASSALPWWREPTKDQWQAYIAAWLGWTLDAFDFTIFLLIMLPISQEFGVPLTAVAIISLIGTLSGHGPLMLSVDASPAERTFVLQLFIGSICALTLPVAIVLMQRRWLENRLASSESNYRLLADYSRADGCPR